MYLFCQSHESLAWWNLSHCQYLKPWAPRSFFSETYILRKFSVPSKPGQGQSIWRVSKFPGWLGRGCCHGGQTLGQQVWQNQSNLRCWCNLCWAKGFCQIQTWWRQRKCLVSECRIAFWLKSTRNCQSWSTSWFHRFHLDTSKGTGALCPCSQSWLESVNWNLKQRCRTMWRQGLSDFDCLAHILPAKLILFRAFVFERCAGVFWHDSCQLLLQSSWYPIPDHGEPRLLIGQGWGRLGLGEEFVLTEKFWEVSFGMKGHQPDCFVTSTLQLVSAGATMKNDVRKPPNCFNFIRQIEILQKAGCTANVDQHFEAGPVRFLICTVMLSRFCFGYCQPLWKIWHTWNCMS